MFGIAAGRTELLSLMADAERGAIGQAGCLRYSFTAAISDPDHFVLLSEWQDESALEMHYRSPTFARFQFALDGLLARPSEMTVYSISGSTRPVVSGPMDPPDAER